MKAAEVRKALVAVGGALAVLTVALADGTVSTLEWVQVAIGALTAAGVYHVPTESDV
jgi:hypothetical protein